ncbi:MAG: alpha/beta hydrolase [Calditrichaeota bacterium]|nr:alpha/beta hydrolase [Calditrichota bacterium]
MDDKPLAVFYQGVEASLKAALEDFRRTHVPRSRRIGDTNWEYLLTGSGDETVLFLHGMAGAWDIWWQQILALREHFRILSLTYPPVYPLAALEQGILALLDQEGIEKVHLVGTSLGGYLAQYLFSRQPYRVLRVVLSNTFPPNSLIARKHRFTGKWLPLVPEKILLHQFRKHVQRVIYPTSGYDELTRAMLMEMFQERIHKAHILARFRCVMESFPLRVPEVPLLIIESANDPLVELELRALLRKAYPDARVFTFPDAGHFPYLNRAQEYSRQLLTFLKEPVQLK